MKRRYLLPIVASILLVQSTLVIAASAKKTITVTERQQMLMSEVDKSEKSGELTVKEAQSLRDAEAKIEKKEEQMKSVNGGKLSYEDINKVEGYLNKISVKLQKCQLAKRVRK